MPPRKAAAARTPRAKTTETVTPPNTASKASATKTVKATPAKGAVKAVKGANATSASARKASTAKPAARSAQTKSKVNTKGTRGGGARGGRGKKIVSPEYIESEAEEGDEAEEGELDEGEGGDEEESVEERTAEDISEEERDTSTVLGTEDEDEEELPPPRKAVEITPKPRRALKKGELPVSQGSPSPNKPKVSVRGRVPTPAAKRGKRTKEDDSDDALDEDASPTKKSRAAPKSDSEEEGGSDDVEMAEPPTPARGRKLTRTASTASTGKKPSIPLPRRQTVAAQAALKAAAARKAASNQTATKGKGSRKVNPPDSGERFFNPSPEDVDEDILQRQTRLFVHNTSSDAAEDAVDSLRYTLEDVKIKSELQENRGTVLAKFKSKDVRFQFNDAMDVDEAREALTSHPLKLSNEYLGDLLNGTVEEHGQDTSGVLDYDTPEALCPILRPTYSGLPLLQPCAIDSGNYSISTQLFGEGIYSEDNFDHVCHRSLLRVALYAGGEPEDDPFVINPARYNPAHAMPYKFISTKSKVLCSNFSGSGAVPQRFICVDMVVVIDCHVVHATHLFGNTSKVVKQIIGAPLRGEHERAGAFFGTVYGESALGFNTYGIGGGPGQESSRVDGISYRTFISNTSDTPRKPVRALKGMGATPGRNRANPQGSQSRPDSVPSRSLIEMRDKTTWTYNDNIGVWDARSYFVIDKAEDMVFRHEKLTSLPACTEDLQFGDIALVYYSVSSYSPNTGEKQTFHRATTALSHNLYGVALLARRLDA